MPGASNRFRFSAGEFHQIGNLVGRQGAFANPGIRLGQIQGEIFSFDERVVGAQLLDECAVASGAFVRYHNAVERAVFRAFAAETDNGSIV